MLSWTGVKWALALHDWISRTMLREQYNTTHKSNLIWKGLRNVIWCFLSCYMPDREEVKKNLNRIAYVKAVLILYKLKLAKAVNTALTHISSHPKAMGAVKFTMYNCCHCCLISAIAISFQLYQDGSYWLLRVTEKNQTEIWIWIQINILVISFLSLVETIFIRKTTI